MSVFDKLARQLGISPVEKLEEEDLASEWSQLEADLTQFEVNTWVGHLTEILLLTGGKEIPPYVVEEFESFDDDKKTAVALGLVAAVGHLLGNTGEDPPDMAVGAFV